jgi:hypothetical protein
MATFSTSVLASTDDARNLNGNGTFSATVTTQHLGKFSATDDYWNGFRWNAVSIPQGATISSATITLYCAATNAGTTANTIWYGEAADNAATFANTTAGKPEGRSRTTASVTKAFTVSNWTVVGYNTADKVTVTSLVQEIINRAGWASGNSLAIVAHDNGSASTNYIGHSTYDRAVDRGAILEVTYTTSAGTTGQVKVYNGSSFVAKPVKIWNGSAWVTKPVKRWDGSTWVTTPY